ncbi:hypothetical protein, partial [Niallia circulans]|uniref:hypothetical protein n=1 Tax=Niallia circulans TaxID=1397 RepID=UPI003009BE45
MNICILTRSTIFHENYGGMEHVAHDLAKELSVLGNNVTMITTSMGENQLKVVELENLGYNFVSLPNMKPMAYSKSWWINVKKYFVELNATYKVDLILSI